VLDVGTGTGAIAGAAASRGATAAGVDLAPEMVERARTRIGHVQFRAGDAEKLPFDSGEFDAVVAGFVFNHLPSPERAAAECRRVVCAGAGRIALAVWDEPRNAPFFGVVAEAMRAAGIDSASLIPPGPDPYRFAREDELRELLLGAGFGGVEIQTLELSVRVADGAELLDGVLGGTVRAATALERVSGPARARVAAALERGLSDYVDGAGVRLPARVKLASGIAAGP
jgi:SAM-dependent methyltransferase